MIIYLITNKINGKRYVGQTVNTLERRWNQHISHSKNKKKSGAISHAIRKHGIENFEIRTVARCDSLEEMNYRESYYIKLFKTLAPSGYNLDSGGKNKLMHLTTKEKISKIKLGKKIGPHSEEHKKNLSKSHLGKKYGPLSETHKVKISEANKGSKHPMFGKKQTEKNKMATSIANKNNKYWVGRKHKNESKIKMSELKKGKFLGEKNPFFGKKHSQKSLNKMSEANNKTKIKVLCLNNGIVYDSKNIASKTLNVGRNQITKVIAGEISHVKGFIFKEVK